MPSLELSFLLCRLPTPLKFLIVNMRLHSAHVDFLETSFGVADSVLVLPKTDDKTPLNSPILGKLLYGMHVRYTFSSQYTSGNLAYSHGRYLEFANSILSLNFRVFLSEERPAGAGSSCL